VRADTAIQYASVPPQPKPETPEWMIELGRAIERLLRPLGELFGMDWRWLMWLLFALATAGALWLIWSLIVIPLLARRKAEQAAGEDEWSPDRDAALALLEDADRLAAAGRFGEAAHLLLQRSVGQIALARPDWLSPASTAREIGALRGLPERARTAFAAIARVVEAGRFALRDTGEGEWRAARAAYADFALADLGARVA
jgi:hypothetical protein